MSLVNTRKTFSRTVLALAAASASLAPPAMAQDKGQLEEIIVTARKMDESMQDVSVAVSAFTGEQIDRLIMRDIREMEGMVPNFVIDTLAVSPAGAAMYIRGVGTQEVERSFDPAVGVVIDGVPLSFVNGSLANTFDFQSIEVLRGPQGTLFGRNTTGGVVNITRNRPTGEWGFRYEATAGSDDLLDFKGVLNIPMGDMFAGKVAFATQKDGSDRSNTTINDDVGNPDNQQIDASLLFTPTDRLDVLFTFVNYQDEGDGVPLQNITSLNTDNPVNPAPEVPCFVGQCGDDVDDITELSQDFGQVVAGDVFHYQVMESVMFTGIVSDHDVRVGQLGCDFDFLVKPGNCVFGFEHGDRQDEEHERHEHRDFARARGLE